MSQQPLVKSVTFYGTGEVEEEIGGDIRAKEKTDASFEIPIRKMKNVIVTILSLLLPQFFHLLSVLES